MKPPEDKTYWNVIIDVMDRAGSLTSVASAFSNRSITLDLVFAHGSEDEPETSGRIVVTFWATEEEKEVMVRILKRLSKVVHMTCSSGDWEGQHQAMRSALESIVCNHNQRN